jgi:PAS domain S-box-containing protein
VAGVPESEGAAGFGVGGDRLSELESENAKLRALLAEREQQFDRLQAGAVLDAQIRLVADALPVLISYVDAGRCYRYNNKAYERWFGRRRSLVYGRHLRDVLGEAAYEELRPLVDAALAGEPVSVDASLPYEGAGERHVHLEYVPDIRQDGSVAGFFALVQDISESKRVEETLRESEARFRAMADCAPAPVWVTSTDGIEFVNKAFVEVAGVPAEGLTGAVWMSIVHPDDLADALERRRRAWEERSPYGYHARFRRADGEWRWMQVSCNPRLDETGTLIGYVGMAVDLTELKRAEDELRESEARFRGMADSAPAPVWVTDAQGIEFANRGLSEFTGLSVEQLRGDTWMKLCHPDDIGAVQEIRAQAWETKSPYAFEARFRRHDGEWPWLRCTCKPRESLAEFLGYVGLAVDITEARAAEHALLELNQSLEARIDAAIAERRRVEEVLRQAQKMEAVGQLTGGIAHDFNNLLTVIGGNLDLAARRLGPDADTRALRAIASAMTGAERAATLTQRLLAFSRRQPLAPKAIDPNALLAGMSDLLHRTLGETIEVETRLAAGIGRIEADPHQLESAILNLAVNARDAMPAGGRLVIETAAARLEAEESADGEHVASGQYVALTVSDTGVGMSADTMQRAVEPFFTTKEVGKGTGLGLSMVYGFVRQSGGHLRIESKENEGTRVHIYLPRIAADIRDEEPAEAAAAPRAGGEETILVCEDDDDVRAYTIELLEELGYRVHHAHDGPATLRLLEDADRRIDMLFTDVVLPGGMTGAELAREAQTLRPGLKVLYTTGYARDAIVHEGRLDPGIDLITKPFTFAELASRVRDMLDRA